MPWDKNEGGNKGPWGQGPWGQGTDGQGGQGPKGPRDPQNDNRGKGSPPPDLDELLKRAKDKWKNAFPKGGGGGSGKSDKGLLLFPLVALAGFWVYMSLYQVQPDQTGVVKRFGAYVGNSDPGLHFAAWPVYTVNLVRTGAENKTPIGGVDDQGLMLTGDQNVVDIKFNVLWRIDSPTQYLFDVADPELMVSDIAESAMREVVGRTSATDMMTSGKLELQQQVMDVLQKTLDGYGVGIKISALTLEQVDAPPKVQDAFKEVQRAQQDQVDSVNKAQQYSNQQLQEAEGQAAKVIQDAEGYKASVVNEAIGDAQRYAQVYEQYILAKDVTRQRIFIETMRDVLGNANKVIVDSKSGQGVVPYLPLPALQTPAQGAK